MRDMWVVRPGVGEGVLGGRGRKKSLGRADQFVTSKEAVAIELTQSMS